MRTFLSKKKDQLSKKEKNTYSDKEITDWDRIILEKQLNMKTSNTRRTLECNKVRGFKKWSYKRKWYEIMSQNMVVVSAVQ